MSFLSAPSTTSSSNNNSNLLSRFFDRIGINEDDKSLLIEEAGIVSITDLILTRGTKPGSHVTNIRLKMAISYLTNSLKRLEALSPTKVLEHVLAIEEWKDHSWEMHILECFDTFVNVEDDMKRMDNKEAEYDASSSNEEEAVKSSDGGGVTTMTPEQLEKNVVKKIQETNLKCKIIDSDSDGKIVELYNKETGAVLPIPIKVFEPLYLHQMEGIEQIFCNFDNGRNGLLLADEMGLGKTRQALVSMFSLMSNERIKRVCVLVPSTLIPNWLKRARMISRYYKVLKGRLNIVEFSSDIIPCEKRNKILREKRKTGNPLLVIASNSLLVNHKESSSIKNPLFPTGKDSGLNWDWVVIDEAHQKMKSKTTKTGKAIRCTSSKFLKGSFRLLLTATPIENKLEDICNLLGLVTGDDTFDKFLERHDRVIKTGQQQQKTRFQKLAYEKVLTDFRNLAVPYILQRSIEEHFKDELPPKEEYVVWIKPSQAQREATKKIINSDTTELAKDSKNVTRIFAMITRHRMTALHPVFADKVTDKMVKKFLETKKKPNRHELDEDEQDDELFDDSDIETSDYLATNSVADIMRDAPSIRVCKDLIEAETRKGHKFVVFCEYLKALDIVAKVLEHSKITFCRFDGNTPQRKRNENVSRFEKDPSIKVMLITLGAGGLGLDLLGADRVILLGAHWNPKKDAQAVARAWRIGQKRDVKVYRLLMSNLIDELVYGKQVQKDSLSREFLTETGGSLTRFFDDKELSDVSGLGKKRGKCEILNRFPKRVIKSSTKKMPFLDNHTKVHGIMRHDAIHPNFSNAYAGETGRRIANKKRPSSGIIECNEEEENTLHGDKNKSLCQGSEATAEKIKLARGNESPDVLSLGKVSDLHELPTVASVGGENEQSNQSNMPPIIISLIDDE